MAWRAILEADVLTQISSDELEALRAAALGDGQADPLQPSINQVTSEVRGYVAACARNELHDTASYVPPSLIRAACVMVVVEIIGRVPGYDVDEGRQKRYDQAVSLMRDVAACRYAIEDPDSGAAGTGASVEMTDDDFDDPEYTRDSLKGL